MSQPERNVVDFKHWEKDMPATSGFAQEMSIPKNPFFITKPIFIDFFKSEFEMEKTSEAEIIFDCFGEFVKGSEIPSTKQICLFAFAFNFEMFLKSSDPTENLLSNRKLQMLTNQLSIYVRANYQLRKNLNVDIPIKYKKDFGVILQRVFKLNKIIELKSRDFLLYSYAVIEQV